MKIDKSKKGNEKFLRYSTHRVNPMLLSNMRKPPPEKCGQNQYKILVMIRAVPLVSTYIDI